MMDNGQRSWHMATTVEVEMENEKDKDCSCGCENDNDGRRGKDGSNRNDHGKDEDNGSGCENGHDTATTTCKGDGPMKTKRRWWEACVGNHL